MKLPRFLRKENPTYKAVFAAYGTMPGPAWRTVDYATFIDEGYVKCVPVHACVSMIAKSGSAASWVLMKNDDELDTHPLLNMLARPNKYEGGQRFTENVFMYLLSAGNSYIYRQSGRPTAPPLNLYWLRPDRMEIKKSGDWKSPIAGYDYKISAKPEFIEEPYILHMKEPHPTDDWYGLSRIEVAAHEIDTWNESVKWNMKVLQNDMRTPGLVTGNVNMDLDKFRQMWQERYQGAGNAATPLFLDGENIKWQSISGTAKDLDWTEGQKRLLRSICSVFGVPSQLLGDTEASTYANYQEARKAFYLETVLPLLDFYRDELNAWLVPLYGDNLRLDYDRDKIEALQEDQGKKYAYLQTSRFLSVNEKRGAVGYDDVPEGEAIMVGMGDVPLSDAIAPPSDLTPPPEPPAPPPAFGQPPAQEPPPAAAKMASRGRKAKWREPDNAKALWEAFDTRAKKRSATFTELAKGYLKDQAARFANAVDAYASLSSIRMEQAFNIHDEAQVFVKHFWDWYVNHYGRAVQAGLRAAKGEVFDDAEAKASWTIRLTPAQEEKLQRMVFNSGTKVNETTIDVIYKELKLAQEQNLPIAQFAQNVRDKVDDLSRSRADLWAATESCKVDNAGQVDGFKETEGVNGKGWLCSFLPTSRPEHEETSGKEIGIDETWRVGDSDLSYPGDPAGKPGDICNCRCSVYPVVMD